VPHSIPSFLKLCVFSYTVFRETVSYIVVALCSHTKYLKEDQHQSLERVVRGCIPWKSKVLNIHTERRDKVVNTPASYSGGPVFKSRPGDLLSWLRVFVVFLSPPGKYRDGTLKLGCHRFLPRHFQFIVHISSFIRRYTYSPCYWESILKEEIRKSALYSTQWQNA
jgi:hypothetical protein